MKMLLKPYDKILTIEFMVKVKFPYSEALDARWGWPL